MTAELRARVHAAAKEVGYVPNLLARSLKGTKTLYIGLIVGNMQEPFFGGIAEAVTDEARALPGIAIVSNMLRDPRLEIELCQQLWEHRVKGLILAGGSYDQQIRHAELKELVSRMTTAGIIVISLAERGLSVPTFATDNETVGRCQIEKLLKLGHTEIGLVFGSPNSMTTQQRVHGIHSAIGKKKVRLYTANADFGLESGGEAAANLLKAHPEITAFLCGGDTLAAGVMHHLKAMGHNVPDDYSIVGIGNTAYSSLTSPQLSTVDTDVSAWARTAVRYIGTCLDGAKPAPYPDMDHQARYIDRGSTAAPRKKRDAHS